MKGDVCSSCNGSGRKEECENCDNKGWVKDPSDDGTMTCPFCDGESGEECKKCEGTGFNL